MIRLWSRVTWSRGLHWNAHHINEWQSSCRRDSEPDFNWVPWDGRDRLCTWEDKRGLEQRTWDYSQASTAGHHSDSMWCRFCCVSSVGGVHLSMLQLPVWLSSICWNATHTLAAKGKTRRWFVSDIISLQTLTPTCVNLYCSCNADTNRWCQRQLVVIYSKINTDSQPAHMERM